MTIIRDLEHEVDLLIRGMEENPATASMRNGSASLATYRAFLTETFHYVRWTQPLLLRAGHRLRDLGKQPEMAALFMAKSEEEFGHEKWALDDLKALGVEEEDIRLSGPCSAVEAYVAWNRFMVDGTYPTGHLGTAYVLEALSVRGAQLAVDNMVRTGLIPNIKNAVGYLTGHAEADEGHVSVLAELIACLKNPAELEAILASARVTRITYLGMCDVITERTMTAAV